jgi:deoxycytidine triphosphate deaminase
MYLSDRDARWAIERKLLIVESPEGEGPPKIDPSSIDLRLDHVDEAKVWDIAAYADHVGVSGGEPVLHVGSERYKYGKMSRFLVGPPAENKKDREQKVYRDGSEIFVRPGGFLLWQTKEKIGTPPVDPRFMCFVDGKSTRARAGLIVHLTAPTIHAGWSGNVTLEIANLGPFTFGLKEDDVIAQITVATISSPPEKTHEAAGSSTQGQSHVEGSAV